MDAGGGITPVGLISIVVLVLVILGVAFVGNRVWPINSRIDSAWKPVEGSAQELTNGLRKAGFTCSDEGALSDTHVHRLCAKYDEVSSVGVEFAGTASDGQVQRVYISSARPLLSQQDQQTVRQALDLSIPDPNHRAAAMSKLARGSADRQQITGPWGSAGYSADGVFVVAGNWPSAPTSSTLFPGGTEGIRLAATNADYECNGAEPMTCQRSSDAAAWTLTVTGSTTPEGAGRIRMEGIVTNPDRLDPARELELVLPPSRTRDRLTWFVETADQRYGHAGFADGVIVNYHVTRNGDRPTSVVIDAHSTCRPTVDGQTVSC